MITTTLCGGLGNQMFIYAMAKAMSLRNRVPVAFNLKTGFSTDIVYKRFLELDKFALVLPTAKTATFDVPFGFYFERISSKLGIHVLQPQYKMIQECYADYHYQNELVDKRIKNAYISGYWQNPKYFEEYAEVIRKDFTLKVELPSEVKDEHEYLRSIKRPLVMVGIRRYQEAVGQPTRLKVCGADYYNNAMSYVAERLDNPLFVIFGQDREWAEQNLDKKYSTYFVKAKSGEMSAVSDLYLMANCNHAIISNSSYYWWGAWLQFTNQNDHIVVCSNNFINSNTPCKEWTIIK